MTIPVTEDGVPWWARVSSLLAPILLIGGWTLAAFLQPDSFDSRVRTISELAALDATDRWVMTAGIAATGFCHAVTAVGLRPAALTGRVLLALGGVATVLVALFPLPSMSQESTVHGLSAAAAFVLLALWPFASWRPGRVDDAVPWGLRPAVAISAGSLLVVLLLVFGVARSQGTDVGLTERIAAGAQALWPAIVVASVSRRPHTPTGLT